MGRAISWMDLLFYFSAVSWDKEPLANTVARAKMKSSAARRYPSPRLRRSVHFILTWRRPAPRSALPFPTDTCLPFGDVVPWKSLRRTVGIHQGAIGCRRFFSSSGSRSSAVPSLPGCLVRLPPTGTVLLLHSQTTTSEPAADSPPFPSGGGILFLDRTPTRGRHTRLAKRAGWRLYDL